MTERNDIFKSVPLDLSSSIKPPMKKSRVVMNQVFSSMMKQRFDQTESAEPTSGMSRRPALPDGTGQIINIGI